LLSEVEKKEFILKINDFNEIDSKEGNYARAILLQTLLFMEPGTDPTDYEKGIGIKRYLSEFDMDSTLKNLENIIKQQVENYLPNFGSYSIIIDRVPEASNPNLNTIGILIKFDQDTDIGDFALLFSKNLKSNNIISRIIV
jgi:hypothetical protein